MNDFVNAAKMLVGCNEADGSYKQIIDCYNTIRPLPRGYDMKYNDPWCAAFVSACAWAVKLFEFPFECSCSRMIFQLDGMKLWEEKDDYTPKPGDLVFYDWQDSGEGDNTGTADHVGIVEKVTDDKITIIEGNYSNAVKRRTIKKNARYIRGWGLTSKFYDPDIIHTVAQGDTLWSIAKKYYGYGPRYYDIMLANKLSSTLIRPGMKLIIP